MCRSCRLGLYRPETTASARGVEARLRQGFVGGVGERLAYQAKRGGGRERPPPPNRSARSNLRSDPSERIVPDRGQDDVVVGRRISTDSDEGFTLDVFVLGAEGHAAIGSLVGVLPEAHRHVRQGSVVRDAVGGRVAGK